MTRRTIQRYALVFIAWLPFFVVWVSFGMIYAHSSLGPALVTSLISMGSASMFGIAVWHVCQRLPWPLRVSVRFYLLHILLALLYAVLWNLTVYWIESLRRGTNAFHDLVKSPLLGWQLLTGVW